MTLYVLHNDSTADVFTDEADALTFQATLNKVLPGTPSVITCTELRESYKAPDEDVIPLVQARLAMVALFGYDVGGDFIKR